MLVVRVAYRHGGIAERKFIKADAQACVARAVMNMKLLKIYELDGLQKRCRTQNQVDSRCGRD
tara:strand:+ start:426 stop:614 length:189 start_codon:yes stop_codon:yes gene_type:complete